MTIRIHAPSVESVVDSMSAAGLQSLDDVRFIATKDVIRSLRRAGLIDDCGTFLGRPLIRG